MKRIFALLFIALAASNAFAQGSNTKYDSTRNFLGPNVNQYVGQELRIAELPEGGRDVGYNGFIIDYKNDDMPTGNTYKGWGVTSTYDSLVGHYFTVLQVIPDPKAATDPTFHASKFFLKLKDKNSHDICYFEYDSTRAGNDLPFYLTGYIAKLKAISLGKQFVFRYSYFKGSSDYETGKPLTLTCGEKWKCIDIVIDKRTNELSLLIQNPAGQKQVASVEWVNQIHGSGSVYTAAEADKYRHLYGNDFDAILMGNVSVGWNKTMCSLAWGDPESVNPTTTSAGTSEQWVYKDDHYLYFDEHNKLTTIQ